MLQNFADIKAYLVAMGFEEQHQPSFDSAEFHSNEYRILFHINTISVLKLFQDDRSRSWQDILHVSTNTLIDQVKFAEILHLFDIVPYVKLLGKLADQSGLPEKRALYLIREALKKSRHEHH